MEEDRSTQGVIEDALPAAPLLRGGEPRHHAWHGIAVAGARRRLTAETFRALTRRLKGLDEARHIPSLFEPPSEPARPLAVEAEVLPEVHRPEAGVPPPAAEWEEEPLFDAVIAAPAEEAPTSFLPEGGQPVAETSAVETALPELPPAPELPLAPIEVWPVEEEVVPVEEPAAAADIADTEAAPPPTEPGPALEGEGQGTAEAPQERPALLEAAEAVEEVATAPAPVPPEPADQPPLLEMPQSEITLPAVLDEIAHELEQEADGRVPGEEGEGADGTDEGSAETARMLLDIMSMPPAALQPQERALAADTLLRLIARMPIKSVMALAERICMMEVPPGLIVKKLINHPNREVAAVVLEKCSGVTDQDLLELIASGDLAKLRMVARRRQISSALVDALIAKGDTSVFLNVVRNPGADISHEAFIELCELAKSHPSLQAPLATRANTPAPVAFELFWFLPSELRRYVLSRFLTDSETLDRILKITMAVDASATNQVAEKKFPERTRIEELVGLVEEGLMAEASRLMASLTGICEACARRLIADPDGEPLTVVMKAMGATRALFSAALERWRTSTAAMLRAERNLDELRSLFDSMSFNKARVLLTYWDWAARKAGPYARRTA
jgi:uncharacterized protein (DUF2336 family)